jgi:hypothetical protein
VGDVAGPTPEQFGSCYARWQYRMNFPSDGWLPLGIAGELWSEQLNHPACAWLDARESPVEPEAEFQLTRTLLQDVLHAAGGVEHEVVRVLDAIDATQRWFDEAVASDPGWRPEMAARMYVPLESSLAWDYANLLTWLRTVEERIERRGRRRASLKLGLLPALADATVRDDVARLLRAFKQAVGGERELTNYALHASQIPSPGTPSGRLTEDGLLFFPIPDPSNEPIYIFNQFTYAEGRDLRSFATVVLEATETLVEGILTSFEHANSRLRAARGK